MTGSNERGRPRKPGLQSKWQSVVDSLEAIIPIYEKGSSRISLFSDRAMREEVASFAVDGHQGVVVLDLGSGPGTMARVVSAKGGSPLLADASRKMLASAQGFDRVQCVFEALPLRSGSVEAATAGFSIRDARDLESALAEISRVVMPGGRFAFCDLGKPVSKAKAWVVGAYIAVAPPLIGFVTGGRPGLRFGSLRQTYKLVLDNGSLSRLLQSYFRVVTLTERQLGGSVVVRCIGRGGLDA